MRAVKRIAAFVLWSCASVAHGLTAAEVAAWEADIRFFVTAAERHHIDPYHTASRDEINTAATALIERLPALNEQQVLVEMMRLARQFNDGHTGIFVPARRRLPFALDEYRLDDNDGYRIVEAVAGYEPLLGRRIVGIGSSTIEEIAAKLAAVAQYVENDYSMAVRTRQHLVMADVLLGLGIIEDIAGAAVIVADDDGTLTTVNVDTVLRDGYAASDRVTVASGGNRYFEDRRVAQGDGLWLGADESRSVVYIHFAAYPPFEEMAAFGTQAAQFLRAHESRHLIIDLRDNGGGDFFLGLLLASALLPEDAIDWRHGVYVLIGNKTYSAAMANAVQFRRILNARLVGAPTGAAPVGYADVHAERLPHSGLPVSFSQRLYRFEDEPSDSVRPDVQLANGWADFSANRDRVIEWVLQDIEARQAITKADPPVD